MATKMSFGNVYQNKLGAGAASGHSSADVTPELHLKMSKKIAQLTKVIYALNTKNDEHETVVQTLKDSHEEELQNLILKTKEKITSYKSSIGQETELRQKVYSLEQSLAEHERNKCQAIDEFADFKCRAEERESNLKVEHSKMVLDLSQDLLAIKKNFEDKLKQLEESRIRTEHETKKTTSVLKEAHAAEIESLRSKLKSESSGLSRERQDLIDQYDADIKKLQNEYNELKTAKEQSSVDYEAKLSKAQAFFERELNAVKDEQVRNNAEEWKMRENTLTRQFSERQHEMEKKIKSVSTELVVCEEELKSYRDRLAAAQSELTTRHSDSSGLNTQVHEARQEALQLAKRLKLVEGELAASRERCQGQAGDLVRKSGQIGTLEATRLSNESTLKDLRSSLAKLEDRLQWMEKERSDLETSKRSLTDQQNQQLMSLERSLEELSVEKQVNKEKYANELESLRNNSRKEQERLNKDHEILVGKLQREHREKTEAVTAEAAEEIGKLRQELEATLDETTLRLTQERDDVRRQLDKTESELTARIESAEQESRRLQSILDKNMHGLGTANSQITELVTVNAGLKSELDGVRRQLAETKNGALILKTELENLKVTHETKMVEVREQLKTQLNQLSNDLDRRWTNTVRRECEELESRLQDQHSEDKKFALKHLEITKEQELEASKIGWEHKLKQLLQEISELRENLSASAQQSKSEIITVQGLADQRLNKLKFEMVTASEEHARAMSLLRIEKEEEGDRLRRETEAAVQVLEEQLTSQHEGQLAEQLNSHREEMNALREETERSRLSEVETKSTHHRQAVEKLKLELTQRHAAEMDQLSRTHRSQMAAAKMELERSIELKQQQDKEHRLRLEDLNEDVRMREKHIDNTEKRLQDLQGDIKRLMGQLEFKGQEVAKVKTEAEEHLRRQKKEALESQGRQMDAQIAEHLRDTQAMLGEFNQAQELLKDKISALQIMLEEAEDRYLNRESRPEDLELIARLREAVSENEANVQKLVDEKRYFQLELINRETNFNKVFNTNPNVGVLNPFASKKKKTSEKREAPRYVSAPSLNTVNGSATASGGTNHQRLDPLPDSPIHDIQLNPKKPLQMPRPPQRSKKFIHT